VHPNNSATKDSYALFTVARALFQFFAVCIKTANSSDNTKLSLIHRTLASLIYIACSIRVLNRIFVLN